MSDTIILNYPDLLGILTQNQRFAVGDHLQAALTVHPSVPRAGHPFVAILLLQNMTDVALDVAATFRLPDGEGNKRYFSSILDRAVVTLKPAEVGYIRYTINMRPDTPLLKSHKISVKIVTRLVDFQAKPSLVRAAEGGGQLPPDGLSQKRIRELNALRKLEFSTSNKGGFLRSNTIDKTFNIEAGVANITTDTKPFWKSLWTLSDLTKAAELGLLRKYAEDIKTNVTKKITRVALFEPLMEKVNKIFDGSGFELTEFEKLMVIRAVMAVLQYMAPDASDKFHSDSLPMPNYSVMDIINREDFMDGEFNVELPNWLTRLLMTAENEKKALLYANRAIVHYCFDDLVRDAVVLSFAVIEQALQEDLGSHEDVIEYGEYLILALNGDGVMDYSLAYMPLIIGGVLMCDWVLLQKENIRHLMDDLPMLLDERKGKVDEDHMPMYEMAERAVKLMRVKYGYPIDL